MEKLKALAWHWQLLILVGIASVIYLGVWYFVTSVTRAETQTLNDEVTQLQSKNQAAQIATQRINEFRSLYASKSAEYDELKVLLPEVREITNVLQGLQDTARDSRLIVMRFSPRDDAQQDGFMTKPVEVEVDSNFNNLRLFFEKMAKLQRIVSISDFNLKQLEKQSSDKTLHAQFLLTAYYASPENLASNNPVQPNGATPNPSAPGQPAAQTVPNAQQPPVPAGR
ncbi:MAG: type 4a pilus biogenesis protein PilO [Acidobacteriota bacterium]|nr:type 4a pilus biogenesis protein PilO [Acidobacteriota bacterium]